MSIWYPYTQAKTSPLPLKVKSAQGVWLELEGGHRILDAISSWWVTLHGHGEPTIAQAIYDQAQRLEQVIFAGFTHDPAEALADRLLQALPQPLSRVFFSDNGSTAVEVALKMAYQYWRNQGQKRPRFLALEGAYHGDTFGAMAVGARSLFSEAFGDLLWSVDFVPVPATYRGDDQVEAKEAQCLQTLRHRLEQQPHTYAALIVEPLVQGAGGMVMMRSSFLEQLVTLCQSFDVLVIFDEVMTGFGRTGEIFACLGLSVVPDLICLSKGITGGFLPMSVTVAQEKIYQAFYSDDPLKTLYHGHSYTANPLGCAAALASWDLLMATRPKLQEFEAQHWTHLAPLMAYPQVEQLRVTGTIAAFNLKTDRPGYLNTLSLQIRQAAIQAGVLLRPLGHVVYLMPPYGITWDELAWVYRVINTLLQDL